MCVCVYANELGVHKAMYAYERFAYEDVYAYELDTALCELDTAL